MKALVRASVACFCFDLAHVLFHYGSYGIITISFSRLVAKEQNIQCYQ